MRSQDNPDIFVKRGLSQNPNSNQFIKLLQSSHGILSRSYVVLVGNSLRSQDAFMAITMHALGFHSILTALTAR